MPLARSQDSGLRPRRGITRSPFRELRRVTSACRQGHQIPVRVRAATGWGETAFRLNPVDALCSPRPRGISRLPSGGASRPGRRPRGPRKDKASLGGGDTGLVSGCGRRYWCQDRTLFT